jgi:peroxiredoxin
MTAFGTSHGEFAGADAQVLGVSMDDLETNKKFAESLKSPFPLLADPKGEAAAPTASRPRCRTAPSSPAASRSSSTRTAKITKVMEGKEALDPSGALSACKGGN